MGALIGCNLSPTRIENH